MNYTDRQMRAFAEIAYMDYKVDFDSYYNSHGKEPVPLTKLLNDKQIKTLKDLGVTQKEINEWKIAAVHDTNDENGFFACVIETGHNEAAVGFRGSEGLFEYKHNKTDWVETNLQLMNSTLNQQQAEVDNFLDTKNDILSRYDNLTMTGHSLGGNLAEYATIVSGKYGLDDNIKKCMSLDGPGFSEEFIKENKEAIEKMSGVMEHVRWSFVGTLLNDLPGDVDYKFLQVSNEANTRDDEQMNFWKRHYTKYLVLEGDSFVEGEQDLTSKVTSEISKGIDHMPSWVGNAFISLIGNISLSVTWMYDQMFDDDENITAVGIAVIVEAVKILFFKPEILLIIGGLVVSVLAFAVIAFAYELAYEKAIELLNKLCAELIMISTWFKEKATEIYNNVVDIINGLKSTYNYLFNAGYRYANNNPNIKVDTYKLNNYAQRISAVNRRLDTLDNRFDKLYNQVGLRDLWYLLQSDLRICYNHKLDKCVMYLYDTAWEFEDVEKNINNIV